MIAPSLRLSQDLAAGALLGGIALAGLWISRGWEQGTLAAAEAGFFPRLVCILLLLLGLVLAGRAAVARGPSLSGWTWRPLAAVTAAVLAFAGLLGTLGLVPAVVVATGFATLAGEPLRPIPLASLAGGLALGCVAIFSWGLGLPLKVLP